MRRCVPRARALDEEIAAGQFGGVMEWLRDNVHAVLGRVCPCRI